MKTIQHLIRNGLIRLLKTLSGNTGTGEAEETHSLYHVVFENRPTVMNEEEFAHLQQRVKAGEVKRTQFYVDQVETVHIAAHHHPSIH